MQVIRNYKQAIVVGETDKSYRVQAISSKKVWWPKAQCRHDFDFYSAQIAMHLWAGYQSTSTDALDTIDTVANISRYVPLVLEADRQLDAQLEKGDTGWDRVFLYDVVQTAGAWLAQNPRATLDAFKAKLQELIA